MVEKTFEKKPEPNRFLIDQYCPILKKIYQEIAQYSKIPDYATTSRYKD